MQEILNLYNLTKWIIPSFLFHYIQLFRLYIINDNLPMIQDYRLQVFVVQTLIFVEFYQFFIIF